MAFLAFESHIIQRPHPGCENANYGNLDKICDIGRTKPVGSYLANGLGLYDTAGNVNEWVQDCYQSNPSSADHEVCDANVVLRGGSWPFAPWNMRTANRLNSPPASRGNDIGFRVAKTL